MVGPTSVVALLLLSSMNGQLFYTINRRARSPTAMDSESNGWVLLYMVSARTMTHRLLHIQRLYRISNPPIREQLVWESFPRMARIHTPAKLLAGVF